MSHDDFAHELRTPLCAIRGAIDLLTLRVSMQSDPDAEALLRLAQRNVDRLLAAVEIVVEEHRVEHEMSDQEAA